MASSDSISRILTENHNVAVVGLSSKPNRDSFQVAQYLQEHGYRILPVNPMETEVLGEKAYPRLEEIPSDIPVHIVDVFRRAEDTPAIAKSAVERGARVLWLQLGIVNEQAREIAQSGGLHVVMDRCIKIELEARSSDLC